LPPTLLPSPHGLLHARPGALSPLSRPLRLHGR